MIHSDDVYDVQMVSISIALHHRHHNNFPIKICSVAETIIIIIIVIIIQ